MTQITTKSGRGVPTASDLVEAELAVDLDSGSLYTKLGDGKVTAINSAAFIGIDPNADNYQYWRYKVNGKNTVNVFSMQDLDFKAGPGIDIQPNGYGIEISATATGGGGSGAGMVISETEPADPVEGMQWLNPTNGLVLFWDDEKWLQMPGGKDGKDGAPGADGKDGVWTDNGDTSISYMDGNVGIGTSSPAGINGDPSRIHLHIHDEKPGSNSGVLLTNGDQTTGKGFEVISSGDNAFVWNREDGTVSLGTNNSTSIQLRTARVTNVYGTLLVDESPVSRRVELIETLHTLREATKDETTLEGLRDAIGNAVGGLIEKFEAMQADAEEVNDE